MKTNILQAFARREGFYVDGSRPNRNNNPGDIEFGRFAIAHGATHGDPRFAVFPTPEAGFEAMKALLQAPRYRGKTVEEAINIWAPPHENATHLYIDYVCQAVGCSRHDKIDGLLEGLNVKS